MRGRSKRGAGGAFVIAGATGNTGGATARAMLERGFPVRLIARNPGKASAGRQLGAEVVEGDLSDARSLAAAFAGARAAYVLNPPAYFSADLFDEARRIADAIRGAALASGIPRLVVLSSIGAHLPEKTGNVLTNRTFEEVLSGLPGEVSFLRPAYLMENWAWTAPAARNDGILPTFLAPSGRAIPMVSAEDVGRAAADELTSSGPGRVIELEGPGRYSPDDAAACFSAALNRPVRALSIPAPEWPAALAANGFTPTTAAAWIELFEAFNSGRIGFEGKGAARRSGSVSLSRAASRLAGAAA